jgi:transposase
MAKFNAAENVPDQYRLQAAAIDQVAQALTNQILALEKSLHPFLIPNTDIQHLPNVPDIGKISAYINNLEIDGIERFQTEKQFFSYCRLVPAADNANRRMHFHSSKDSNKYLKIAFSDAAVHAIQLTIDVHCND